MIITCFQLKVFACRLILKRGAHSEMVFSHKVTWSSENRFGRAEIYHQPVKEIATDFYITATSLIMCAGHDFVTDPRIPLPPVSLWAPTLNLMPAKVPGGVLPEKLGRGVLPETLTLFMTKICDFPFAIYDLTKNLIPYL